MHTILIAEDECEIRDYLRLALTLYGLKVEFAQSGEEVVSLVARQGDTYALILMDILMPVRDGIQSLKAVQQLYPDLPVIMMSAAATPSIVITAMANGAKDFLAKPISHDELRNAIEKTLDITLPVTPSAVAAQDGAGARSLTLAGAWSRKFAILLDRVASSDVPVLLQGETGVGKEVIGRKLHARSRRANRPFLKLNCAALPSELVESELFGYEKGAFTGAFKSTPGKFEMANGGTILLDEIGDMDFKLQAKLLQVIQDKEFLRLGAKETSRVDVRIMAASHCDFDKAIREGRFREDLFYRLNIIDIHIPPLRERVDEILPLAEFFLQKYATPDTPILEISPSLRQVLLDHTWPGNVRELENIMQKLLVLRNPALLTEEIRRRVRRGTGLSVTVKIAEGPGSEIQTRSTIRSFTPDKTDAVNCCTESSARLIEMNEISGLRERSYNEDESRRFTTLQESPTTPLPSSVLSKVQDAHRAAEAEAILAALSSSLWNRKQAASLLNIDYKALLYKMKKLGIGEKVAAVG
jgi:two-component system, NtrC family, response regulator AtoC